MQANDFCDSFAAYTDKFLSGQVIGTHTMVGSNRLTKLF